MPKCPKCNASGSLNKTINGENIRKCWNCDHVYSKHLLSVNARFAVEGFLYLCGHIKKSIFNV